MKKMLAWAVEMLPEYAQLRIRNRYWQIKSRLLYQFPYRVLELEHTLPSGLSVKVASKGEWWIYDDIFVDGEYDIPIHKALKGRSSGRPFVVLDLGANVGYFAVRVLDLIGQQELEQVCPDITMVEGSPKTFLELEKRVRSQRQFAASVRLVHGLVGQPRGSAFIREGAVHVKNTIVGVPVRNGARVEFVDLDSLMGDRPETDLLKCDIEGAELVFIQNHAGLLRKVQRAVFELHHDQCDTRECVKVLDALGFHQTVLRANDSFSVSFFARS